MNASVKYGKGLPTLAKAQIQAVDLFCGVGGLTQGLRMAGVQVTAGYDLEARCRHAYEYNNGAKFIAADVSKLRGKDLAAHFSAGKYRLLAGCAPCQPFSRYTQGREAQADPKWGLLGEFARLIKELKPEFVTMENVATLTRHSVLTQFLEVLNRLDYWSDLQIVPCEVYGLPQMRRRLVLIASRLGPITLPAPDNSITTVRQAIGHLPAIGHGMRHPKDALHSAATLSAINLKRIRASSPGGTWRDWPKSLRAECHLRDSGQSYPQRPRARKCH